MENVGSNPNIQDMLFTDPDNEDIKKNGKHRFESPKWKARVNLQSNGWQKPNWHRIKHVVLENANIAKCSK